MGTVTIHAVHYLESDIYEGDVPRDDVRTTVYDEITARQAADIIRREGLTFAATGNDWAANPDGSRAVNYATGEMVEESAHLSEFHPRVVAAIMAAVDGADAADFSGGCGWIPDGDSDTCSDGCGLDIDHGGRCRDRVGGEVVRLTPAGTLAAIMPSPVQA